jgi:hypothetical protein
MARYTPLPRFRLCTDPITEQSDSDVRAVSPSSNMSQQRSQVRIRRSACSDLQSTAIPEERVYNGNRRRASLFVGRASTDITKKSSENQELSEGDYVKLCRQKCQSLYRSLANTTSPINSTEESLKLSDHDDEDEDEKSFKSSARSNHRYSLPDASPAALALRNFLKRNKTTKHHHHHIALPSNSSHSIPSSISTNSSSSISTFRNFLSLVKLPSTKPTNSSSSSHHSSLTTLTNATGGSSSTLDEASSSISSTTQWYFQVSIH